MRILQASTNRLTWVNFTYLGYFWRHTMVYFIYKRIDSKDRRQVLVLKFKVQISGSNSQAQN